MNIIKIIKTAIIYCIAFTQPVVASNIIHMQAPIEAPDDIPIFNEANDSITLDQFQDKTILVVFWATWCSMCLQELLDLELLQKDFRKLAFQVVAVSEDYQGIKAVTKHFTTQNIHYLKAYHDYQNQLFKVFEVSGIPTAFLIDPSGKIVVKFVGSVNWHDDDVRKIILSKISGNPTEPKNSYRQQLLNRLKSPITVPETVINSENSEHSIPIEPKKQNENDKK